MSKTISIKACLLLGKLLRISLNGVSPETISRVMSNTSALKVDDSSKELCI